MVSRQNKNLRLQALQRAERYKEEQAQKLAAKHVAKATHRKYDTGSQASLRLTSLRC